MVLNINIIPGAVEDARVFNVTEFALFVTYLMNSITMMEMDMLRLWPPTVGVMVSVWCTLKRESLSVHFIVLTIRQPLICRLRTHLKISISSCAAAINKLHGRQVVF